MSVFGALRSRSARSDQPPSTAKPKPNVAHDSAALHSAAPVTSSDVLSLQRQGLRASTMLAAQRLLGNRAVMRMMTEQSSSHSAGCGCGTCSRVQRQAASAGRLQRHSSFEHKMLGDVSPEFLQIISSKGNLNAQGNAVGDVRDAHQVNQHNQTIRAVGGDFDGVAINADMINHVLDQEIARINFFKNQTEPKKKQNDPVSGYQTQVDDVNAAKDYQADLRQKDYARQVQIQNQETSQGTIGSNRDITTYADWDLQMVAVPSVKNFEPLLVSYGEMNTLADIYGSPAELKAADPVDRWKIIQGIRQQALFRFMDFKYQVNNDGKSTSNPYLGEGFTGAYGNTGRADNVGPLPLGEASLSGGKKGAQPVDAYTSSLARNACHFAPESWYTWAKYHRNGLRRANDGYNYMQLLPNAASANDRTMLQNQADIARNDALLENGFGDHYLQDSYAAGHLINKTGIMQLFIQWMDQHPEKWDFMQDKNWRQMQNMAYTQPGLGHMATDDHYNVDNVDDPYFAPKDPQSVENIQDNPATGTDWTTRFSAAGLVLPPSLTPDQTPGSVFQVLLTLQERSLGLLGSDDFTLNWLTGHFPQNQAQEALKQLLREGIVYVKGQGQKDRGEMLRDQTLLQGAFDNGTFILDNVYRPSNKKRFLQLRQAMNSAHQPTRAQAEKSYTDMGMQVQYNAYHMMLKNTAIQLATNVMHNKYCKEGLDVEAGNGYRLGHIYGDDAMNNVDSQRGVQYSATTSHMSRDSINYMFQHGQEPANSTTDDIAQRFPTRVKVNRRYVRIDQWHGSDPFKDDMDETFGNYLGEAKTRTKVGIMVAKDTAVKTGKNIGTLGLINVFGDPQADIGDVTAVVSKDEVHSGDVF